MEQPVDPNRSTVQRLTEGFKQSVLNVGRACVDFIQFDPHPDAISATKPEVGLLNVIRQIRKEREIGRS